MDPSTETLEIPNSPTAVADRVLTEAQQREENITERRDRSQGALIWNVIPAVGGMIEAMMSQGSNFSPEQQSVLLVGGLAVAAGAGLNMIRRKVEISNARNDLEQTNGIDPGKWYDK